MEKVGDRVDLLAPHSVPGQDGELGQWHFDLDQNSTPNNMS